MSRLIINQRPGLAAAGTGKVEYSIQYSYCTVQCAVLYNININIRSRVWRLRVAWGWPKSLFFIFALESRASAAVSSSKCL
jgi:hypothetical protein